MEPLSTIFLFIAILALIAAWALSRAPADPLDAGDMGPESVLQHGIPPMEDEYFGKRRHVPPIPLPAPAPEFVRSKMPAPAPHLLMALPVTGQTSEPKRRRKPRPQPKRETKPDTRKVERKGR